jgi:NAD(P)-dependent dehydrogenase (short-subunit alcohol dehydrogenase family)
MTAPYRVDGKRALVTGGSTGIGLASAKALTEAGADVVLAARDAARLDDAVTALRRDGHAAEALVLDVTDEAAVDSSIQVKGPFDILVNNAGTHQPQPFLEIDTKTFDRLFDVNVRGVFLVARAVARGMVAAGRGGVIINMSSQLGHVGAAGRVTYTATKHAVEGMTKAMALDLASYGIRVVSVAPTFTETEMTKRVLTEEARNNLLSRLPIGRFATPDDIANIVVFLASPAAAMMTGCAVMADGGWTAQ